MLGLGLIGRVASGGVADKHRRTGRRCSSARRRKAFALLLYLGFNGLTSLYIVSGAVRPVPGRHHPDGRRDRARILPAAGGRHARRRRD